jgi:iron complex transport system ATP-binding protein
VADNFPAFQLSDVSYAYGRTLALKSLTIGLEPRKFYGIIGPNGCGKSTFLDLLVANKTPDTGQVFFKNKDISQYARRDLARQVALVPQDFTISFAYTVEEVVMMGRHPYIGRFASPAGNDWQKVEQAMSAIGISHFGHRFVNELSGGEKQRVVVARALAQDTPVLIFDEATSNLDIQYTLQIFQVARQLVAEEGRTVIAVIHNMNLAAAYCDDVVFMKEGRIVSHGPTDEVMNPESIQEIFGVESEVKFNAFSATTQISFKY